MDCRGEGPSRGEQRVGRAKKTEYIFSSLRAKLGLWVTGMRLGIAWISHGDVPVSLPEHGNTSVEQDIEGNLFIFLIITNKRTINTTTVYSTTVCS